MRLLYTIVFLFLTTITYGQKSILFQNVNDRAKELKHSLNASEDHIILQCERTIYEVVIYNNDFHHTIKVKDTATKIPIKDIPVGRYIVETLLRDKLIVITLVRNEPFDMPESAPLISANSNSLEINAPTRNATVTALKTPKKDNEVDGATVTEELPTSDHVNYGSESAIKKTDLAVAAKSEANLTEKAGQKRNELLTAKEGKVATKSSTQNSLEIASENADRVVRTYWVIYKMNNGHRSEKIQKLTDKATVDRMIKKNEIDLKTKSGRLNELSIWSIYDTTEFVRHKRKNKENYLAVDSESFNNVPYYNNVSESK
ncbi:hypothetical protein [Winogradskyella vidalii]|uniref:hypothetical protein n=1 Tax=Winogradskyella vidalii TaxID=2615024 RepID=UPI0015CBEC6E|nr:hypothetical protein [Winogradskyella vidalii]